MAGNNLRCVGKYMYDRGYLRTEHLSVETAGGIRRLKLFCRDGQVSSVSVDMGRAKLDAASVPLDIEKLADSECNIDQDTFIKDFPVEIANSTWRITCLSVGNPHCVVFCDTVDTLDLETVGPQFEHAEIFPERVNTEFVRVVSRTALRMRVWERGNGATLACGTGACAAVVAAVENGFCDKGTDVRVTLPGGDLTVNYTDDRVVLTGSANVVFSGTFEY